MNRLLALILLTPLPLLHGFGTSIQAVQQYPNIPSPSPTHLHQGWVEKAPRDPARAPLILTIDETGGWLLFVKAHSSYLNPVGLRKPVADIMWKHNQEHEHSWRRLRTSEDLVYDGSNADGPVTVYLDLKAAVSWDDLPADYSAPVEFVLRRA